MCSSKPFNGIRMLSWWVLLLLLTFAQVCLSEILSHAYSEKAIRAHKLEVWSLWRPCCLALHVHVDLQLEAQHSADGPDNLTSDFYGSAAIGSGSAENKSFSKEATPRTIHEYLLWQSRSPSFSSFFCSLFSKEVTGLFKILFFRISPGVYACGKP